MEGEHLGLAPQRPDDQGGSAVGAHLQQGRFNALQIADDSSASR